MKIDKSKPIHWIYLAIFLCNVVLALPLALLPRRKGKLRLVLYGHKLNGNLLAIHEEAQQTQAEKFDSRFLTMDPAYYGLLVRGGTPCLLALNPIHVFRTALADAVVSDHGLHSLSPLLRIGRVKFIDVWHGIPFKGFDADDFRTQHQYDRILLPSELIKELYISKFGFRSDRLAITGYARTDRLRHTPIAPPPLAKARADKPTARTILFAPTWQQDDGSRNMIPFGIKQKEFFTRMQTLCKAENAVCVVRTHLNATPAEYFFGDRIVMCPASEYPDTEALLSCADVLICDWSSIAFDFLLLDRATLFLDAPPPFGKGFSLGPEYRFGFIIKSEEEFFATLKEICANSQIYWMRHSEECVEIKNEIYGPWADGHAATRCLEEIAATIDTDTNRQFMRGSFR